MTVSKYADYSTLRLQAAATGCSFKLSSTVTMYEQYLEGNLSFSVYFI